MIKYLEQENLQEVIKNDLWLVDFYADWCGPCKMIGKVLEEIEENILKINVDTHEKIAQEFGVMSIPTVCFFKNGELKKKEIGFRSKEELQNIINSLK